MTPQFSANPMRSDPYKQFKFRIKWDGRYVAGVSKVSPLKRTTEVVSHREGGGQGAEVSLADFRKDIRVELQNEPGQLMMAFNVFRCWPSEYVAIGPLDADDDALMAIESLTLQHEGWLRDPDVPEPKEPSFNVPPP